MNTACLTGWGGGGKWKSKSGVDELFGFGSIGGKSIICGYVCFWCCWYMMVSVEFCSGIGLVVLHVSKVVLWGLLVANTIIFHIMTDFIHDIAPKFDMWVETFNCLYNKNVHIYIQSMCVVTLLFVIYWLLMICSASPLDPTCYLDLLEKKFDLRIKESYHWETLSVSNQNVLHWLPAFCTTYRIHRIHINAIINDVIIWTFYQNKI